MSSKEWAAIYRQRADEARRIASMMYSNDHRAQMRVIAEAYDKMALEVEEAGDPSIIITIDSDTKYRQ